MSGSKRRAPTLPPGAGPSRALLGYEEEMQHIDITGAEENVPTPGKGRAAAARTTTVSVGVVKDVLSSVLDAALSGTTQAMMQGITAGSATVQPLIESLQGQIHDANLTNVALREELRTANQTIEALRIDLSRRSPVPFRMPAGPYNMPESPAGPYNMPESPAVSYNAPGSPAGSGILSDKEMNELIARRSQ